MNRNFLFVTLLALMPVSPENVYARNGYSDGKFPAGQQMPIYRIQWNDWRSDTFGCGGKRWTYLDSIDRSVVKGMPEDTIRKYLGAPLRTERFEEDSRWLWLFTKKTVIPYFVYPITSNCSTHEPWYTVRIYFDKHHRVLGMARHDHDAR